jgi:hypothetical protein
MGITFQLHCPMAQQLQNCIYNRSNVHIHTQFTCTNMLMFTCVVGTEDALSRVLSSCLCIAEQQTRCV